eukprot:4493693-Pleurochrysis_carterae.AAC.1
MGSGEGVSKLTERVASDGGMHVSPVSLGLCARLRDCVELIGRFARALDKLESERLRGVDAAERLFAQACELKGAERG